MRQAAALIILFGWSGITVQAAQHEEPAAGGAPAQESAHGEEGQHQNAVAFFLGLTVGWPF